MNIEVSVLMSLISLVCGLSFGYAGFRRVQKQDDREDAAQSAVILVKLETISRDLSDIKKDNKKVSETISDLQQHVSKLDSAVKNAHHRINDLKGE